MTKFDVAVTWRASSVVSVEADNLEDAMKKARDALIPDEWEFIEGSFQVDYYQTKELNEEE